MGNTEVIAVAEIEQGLSENIRPFLSISAAPMAREFRRVVEAFWLAASKIEKVMWMRRQVHVVFALPPFKLNLSNGTLTYTPHHNELINVHVEDIIFLNYEKMLTFKFQIQVACILEELVHVLMNISDESLVSKIVELLYDAVKVVDGKYSPVENG